MGSSGTCPDKPCAASAPTILVVDDDSAIVEALNDALGDEGYCVATARNGANALEWLAEHPAPSLILLDLMMPVMDGYEFRRRQLSDARLAAIPTVVLSASARDEAVAQMDGITWLQKPISLDTLLGVVERRLSTDSAPDWDHHVHFYTGATDLLTWLASFVVDALRKGDSAVVLARAERLAAVRAAIDASNVVGPASVRETEKRLMLLDCEQAMTRIFADGSVDPQRFAELVPPMLADASRASRSGHVSVYGEVVDVLWQRGDSKNALRLEALWNEHGAGKPLALFCGYLVNQRVRVGAGWDDVRQLHVA